MATKIYVLSSKTESGGTVVEGSYSTAEKARKAMEALLRRHFYEGFSEFCSEDEDWNGELNPFLTPANYDGLKKVLDEMCYENDDGEWACVTETELDE